MFASLPIWMLGLWFVPPHAMQLVDRTMAIREHGMMLAQDYGSGTPYLAGRIGGVPIAASSWTSAMVAVYRFEDASPSTDLGDTDTAASCGTDCDLTSHAGSPAQNTSLFVEGQASLDLNGVSYMECANTVCNEFNQLGNHTLSCWVYPDVDAVSVIAGTWSGADEGYALWYDGTPDNLTSNVLAGTQPTDSTANGTLVINTWQYATTRYNQSAGTVESLVNAVGNGSTGTATGCCDAIGTFNHFHIGTYGAEFFPWQGMVDECVWDTALWTDMQLCWAGSCGVAGEKCACLENNPAEYFPCANDSECRVLGGLGREQCDTAAGRCQGRNSSLMGSCALPACNAAAP